MTALSCKPSEFYKNSDGFLYMRADAARKADQFDACEMKYAQDRENERENNAIKLQPMAGMRYHFMNSVVYFIYIIWSKDMAVCMRLIQD